MRSVRGAFKLDSARARAAGSARRPTARRVVWAQCGLTPTNARSDTLPLRGSPVRPAELGSALLVHSRHSRRRAGRAAGPAAAGNWQERPKAATMAQPRQRLRRWQRPTGRGSALGASSSAVERLAAAASATATHAHATVTSQPLGCTSRGSRNRSCAGRQHCASGPGPGHCCSDGSKGRPGRGQGRSSSRACGCASGGGGGVGGHWAESHYWG